MNEMQHQVSQFMQKMRQYIGDKPHIPPSDVVSLRARLVQSESNETQEALWKGDLVETIDGLCDSLYVIFGTAEAIGVDIMPFFDEVHRSNMLKDPDYKDEHGKVIKPTGWKQPDIKGMLDDCNAFVEYWSGKDNAKLIYNTFAGEHVSLKTGLSYEIIDFGASGTLTLWDENEQRLYIKPDEISWRNTWAVRYREQKKAPWPTERPY